MRLLIYYYVPEWLINGQFFTKFVSARDFYGLLRTDNMLIYELNFKEYKQKL